MPKRVRVKPNEEEADAGRLVKRRKNLESTTTATTSSSNRSSVDLTDFERLFTEATDLFERGIYMDAFSVYSRCIGLETVTPENKIDALKKMVLVQENLGKFDDAMKSLEECQSLVTKHYGKENIIQSAQMQIMLGSVQNSKGFYATALETLEECKLILENANETILLARALYFIGFVLRNQGRFSAALEVYSQSQEIYEKYKLIDSTEYAELLRNVGSAYKNQGKSTDALVWYRKSKAVYERLKMTEHPDFAIIMHNTGLILKRLFNDSQAAECFTRCKAIQEKTIGVQHYYYAVTLSNLGYELSQKSHFSEALILYEQARVIEENVFPNHPSLGLTYYTISWILYQLTRYEKAWEMVMKAKAIQCKLGIKHPSFVSTVRHARSIMAVFPLDDRPPEIRRARYLEVFTGDFACGIDENSGRVLNLLVLLAKAHKQSKTILPRNFEYEESLAMGINNIITNATSAEDQSLLYDLSLAVQLRLIAPEVNMVVASNAICEDWTMLFPIKWGTVAKTIRMIRLLLSSSSPQMNSRTRCVAMLVLQTMANDNTSSQKHFSKLLSFAKDRSTLGTHCGTFFRQQLVACGSGDLEFYLKTLTLASKLQHPNNNNNIGAKLKAEELRKQSKFLERFLDDDIDQESEPN